MPGALRVGYYDWSGGREAMLRFGPPGAPGVIAALPLFEEANRTRAFTVTMLRTLAERGIASVLPDFPGTGESLVPTGQARLATMREAYRALAAHLAKEAPVHAMGVRGGALLDSSAVVGSRWHLAPADGPALLRDLLRVHAASGARSGSDNAPPGDKGISHDIEIAGNLLTTAMQADLRLAVTGGAAEAPRRVLRLASDPLPANARVEGSALWRRAEPGNDPAMAERLADDLAGWIAGCGG